jgi:hypothetical protein
MEIWVYGARVRLVSFTILKCNIYKYKQNASLQDQSCEVGLKIYNIVYTEFISTNLNYVFRTVFQIGDSM